MRLPAFLHDTIEDQRITALLWAPVAFGTGIGIYFSLPQEPPLWLGAGAVVAALLALLAAAISPGRAVLALAGLLVGGIGAAQVQTERFRAPILEQVYWGPVSGRVVGLDRSESNRIRVMLDRVRIPGMQDALVPRHVRLVLMTDPAPGTLHPGAHVMTTARLTPPPAPVEPGGFDFRRHAWFMRLGAIGSAPHPLMLAEPGADRSGAVAIFALRMAIAERIMAAMPERTGPFAAAILTGDRSAIDPQDLVNLRASNLAHLLAISGLHMGLLSGFVFALLRYGLSMVPAIALRVPVKKVAAVAALCAGAGYLVISGASFATQRAFVMAAVVLIAILLDRPALTLRAVAVAALIVLVLQPFSLLGPGFQMSFAATIGLVWVFDLLKRLAFWRRMDRGRWRYLKAVLAVVITSAAAGIATAPISAFHFNQLSRFGLIANLGAVPAMGLLVMPAAVLTFALMPLGLERFGFALMDLGIAHILNVVDRVAALDGATRTVPSAPSWVLVLVTIGGLLLVVPRGRLRLSGVPLLVLALVGWHGARRPDILVSPDGSLVGVMTAQGRGLSRPKGQGFAARIWLENDGETVDQRHAAGRLDAGAYALTEGLTVTWTDEPTEKSCGPEILVIAPKSEQRPTGNCIFIGKADLARNGAYAFWISEKLRSDTVLRHSGRRPWTLAVQ